MSQHWAFWWTKLRQQPRNGYPDLAPWIAAKLHMRRMLATLLASSLALVSSQADEIWDDLIVVFVSDSWQIKPFIHSLSLCTVLGCQRFAPGTALAIIPAHLKILSLRSADGVSAHTLLLTNVQQMLASWNMLVLKFPQMQMCLCLESSLLVLVPRLAVTSRTVCVCVFVFVCLCLCLCVCVHACRWDGYLIRWNASYIIILTTWSWLVAKARASGSKVPFEWAIVSMQPLGLVPDACTVALAGE